MELGELMEDWMTSLIRSVSNYARHDGFEDDQIVPTYRIPGMKFGNQVSRLKDINIEHISSPFRGVGVELSGPYPSSYRGA